MSYETVKQHRQDEQFYWGIVIAALFVAAAYDYSKRKK